VLAFGHDSVVNSSSPVERAATVAALGLAGRLSDDDARALVDLVRADPDARVRVAALGALVRGARRALARDAWLVAASDEQAALRRRAAELAPALGRNVPLRALRTLLADDDGLVAEAAAFALGERAHGSTRVIGELASAATAHADPLVREAAVAALGALGDDQGLPAILQACTDRPAIRRRAVLALAAFDGEEVEAALDTALTDNDWQVRQAAEDLRAQPRS
jgi:HEAT repeat protein